MPSCSASYALILALQVQVKKCADSGADIVRITVQGKQEATACYKIREQLFKDGCASCLAHSLMHTGSMQESKTELSMHGGNPLGSPV